MRLPPRPEGVPRGPAPSPGGQPLGRRPRSRAAGSLFLVERLEERVLLSRGSGGGGSPVDPRFAADPSISLAKARVVELRIADLLADGIDVPVQPGGAPDGRIQALRFDDTLLIGGQFYQYASGKGYPLIPVAGPSLGGDAGVE